MKIYKTNLMEHKVEVEHPKMLYQTLKHPNETEVPPSTINQLSFNF